MSKRILVSVLLSLLCVIVFLGCTESRDQKARTITSSMTFREIKELMGNEFQDEFSGRSYPYFYSWELDEHSRLYVLFETKDKDAFLDKMHNGDFELPNEERQYTPEGVEMMTENEMNALKEWVHSHKAVYAYIICDDEKEVLFDVRSEDEKY